MFPLADVWSFPLWPATASTSARATDRLFVFELVLTASITLAIFLCIIVFAIKYRRRSDDERPRPIRGNNAVEFFWSATPLVIFLFLFGWSANVFFADNAPPKDSIQIYVVAKQWMWYVQHPGGQREINELHVPVGRPVQLIMSSQDVIHSFFVPAFRVHRDVIPGATTTTWFQATQPGAYHLFCSQYCGTDHSLMTGSVYVMKPADFEAWLAGNGQGESMAAAGGKLFERLGCVNCHVVNMRCPNLTGLYGKGVGLADGRTVIADEAYIRESILNPGAKIVAGFPNIMPSFTGLVTEVGVQQLIAYVKSLGTPALAGPGAGISTSTDRPSREQQQAGEHVFPPAENPRTPQQGREREINPQPEGEPLEQRQ